MLFLITQKQKNKILDEYYSGIINIITIAITALFIIFLVSLFPSYLTMKVDRKILTDKIALLQSQIDKYKAQAEQNDALAINNNISILSLNVKKETIDIYNEIKDIYKKIPNIEIVSIDVNSLDKKVIVVANIDNKNTASVLVDTLNSTRYKGVDLPYSVFSQSKNFIFSQTLTYE
jgi:seryl-tRNA synthetase